MEPSKGCFYALHISKTLSVGFVLVYVYNIAKHCHIMLNHVQQYKAIYNGDSARVKERVPYPSSQQGASYHDWQVRKAAEWNSGDPCKL